MRATASILIVYASVAGATSSSAQNNDANNAGGGNFANGNPAGGNNTAGGNNAANGAGGNHNFGENNAAGGNGNLNLNAAGGNNLGGGNAAGGNNAPANGFGGGNASKNAQATGMNGAGGNAVPANAAAGNAVGNPAPLNGTNPPPVNAAPAKAAPTNGAIAGNANNNNNSVPANAAANTAAAAPAQPDAPPGPNGRYEMRFQFDQHGTPSMHTFLLKWGAPKANLQSIDVLVSDTDEVLQTIKIPQDRIHLVWNDVYERQDEIRDKFIDSLDYNFDKYADLRLLKQWPYKVGDKYYAVWLFDEHKNQYVLNEAISALPAPVPNPKTKRIESTVLGAYGGGEYVTRTYSINPAGKLKVQSKVTQTIRDRMRLTYMREVRVRIAGELQRVCKIVVPAEGKPKRLWGDRGRCEEFLTKDPPPK
jgi:hypothetical protein